MHGLSCLPWVVISYKVPKQVGKIGTESPTFVEPIAERKDGIAAMFSKQLQHKTSTVSPPKMNKRKGSPIDSNVGQEVKKAKVDIFDVDVWQDDSDIEYINKPPMKSETNVTPHLHSSCLVANCSFSGAEHLYHKTGHSWTPDQGTFVAPSYYYVPSMIFPWLHRFSK